MSWLLVSCVLTPMITAILSFLLPGDRWTKGLVSCVGSLILCVLGGFLLYQVSIEGVVSAQMGGWQAPMGITLVSDHLSALLVLVTGIVALIVSFYSMGDIDDARTQGGFYTFLHILITGVVGAFLTGDLFNLYVWFEVMLISSFALIVLGGDKEQLEGGVKYVAINLVSTVLLLTAIGLVYGLAGTLNMADLNGALAEVENQNLVAVVSLLFLIAFGIKAAVFPLYFWLPASYHNLPISIAAVFAALMTKVGVYALIRSFTLIFTPQDGVIELAILIVALITMIVGILGAISHTNVRRILSYHVIASIGFMLLGLGIGSELAMAASIFYMIQGILLKALLFLIVGTVENEGGSSELSRLGGLYKARPGLSILYLLAALALVGIPPLSGFWAKVMILEAGVSGELWWVIAIVILASLLTFIPLMRIWFEAFWKAAPVTDNSNDESQDTLAVTLENTTVHRTSNSFTYQLPIVSLSLLLLMIGLAPNALIILAEQSAAGVLNVEPYVQQVLGQAMPVEDTLSSELSL